ncbi:hypothetical protein K8I31_15830 [bacterium]|nr:hypothetical protein [bacterium]
MRILSIVFFLTAMAALIQPVFAGGPLIVVNGRESVWPSNLRPVRYAIDPGSLGSLSHSQAASLVEQSFEAWSNVDTSVMRFQQQSDIRRDITGSNYKSISSIVPTNVNPVIFDDDGEIIDLIFGNGMKQHILGGAIPEYIGNQIVRAEVIYNGLFFQNNQSSDQEILVTMKHEVGHLCGLDHTQHSRLFANNGINEDDAALSIMYPTTSDNDAFRLDLSLDDQRAISNLYPSANYLSNSGRVTGRVRRGSKQLPGVNVLLRDVEDPFYRILTTVTGTFDANQGTFEFTGVPPGKYHLFVEPIDEFFTAASSVGQYSETSSDASYVNPVQIEYYNSSDDASEARSLADVIEVKANQSRDNINVQVDSGNMPDDEYRFGLLPLEGKMQGFTDNDRILFEPSGDEGRIILRVEYDSANQYYVEVKQDGGGRKVASASSRQTSVEIELSDTGDLPLERARYFIFVATYDNRTIGFTLSASVSELPTPTPEPTATPTPVPTATPVPYSLADVNQDGAVNASDLFSFAQDWRRAHEGQARFQSQFAHPASSVVDQNDLLAWIRLYLQERDKAK